MLGFFNAVSFIKISGMRFLGVWGDFFGVFWGFVWVFFSISQLHSWSAFRRCTYLLASFRALI